MIAPRQTSSFPDTGGRFRVLKRLSGGGVGEVYLAEQEEPVRRRVALKVIKCGMHSPEVLARFAVERQILALLHHPGIATILEAGSLSNGDPYFVMEWIDGVPITDYCDQRRLTIAKRLCVFDKLCQAVEHAHQRGVIHRDLKPSNILVVHGEGEVPLVKVIDFGIARASAIQEDETCGCQSPGELNGPRPGTLQYMSPEQARGDFDIDTRADIYSLGAVLYELLTGSAPLTAEDIRSENRLELLKRIRLVDPPTPSARIRDGGEEPRRLASLRSTRGATLSRTLCGEIDWIIMKALEKERSRRYDSVRALASDISRYLRGEPLSVGPPSGLYRTRKFIKRHSLACGAFGLAVATLLGGTFFAWAQYRQEIRAIEVERSASRETQSEQAREEAFLEETEKMALDMTTRLVPSLMERGRLDLLGPVIDELSVYLERRDSVVALDPSDLGRLELARARWFWRQDDRSAAREASLQAKQRFESLLGPEKVAAARDHLDLARLLRELGEREEALSICHRLVAEAERLGLPRVVGLRSVNQLARWSEDEESFKSFFRSADELARDLPVDDLQYARAVAEFHVVRALGALMSGDSEEAETGFEQAINLLHRVVREDPRSVPAKLELADAYACRAEQWAAKAGVYYQHEAAARDCEAAAALYEEVLALDPDNVPIRRRHGELCGLLGRCWQRAGQTVEADQAFARALRSLGSERSPEALGVRLDRIAAAMDSEKLGLAREQLESMAASFADSASRDGGSWVEFSARFHLLSGRMAWTAGEMIEAAKSFDLAAGEARAVQLRVPGDPLRRTELAEALEWRARARSALGQMDPAFKDLQEAQGIRRRALESGEMVVKETLALAENEALLAEVVERSDAQAAVSYRRAAHERLVYLLDVAKVFDADAANLRARLVDRLSLAEGSADFADQPPKDAVAEARRLSPQFDESYRLSHRGQNRILAYRYDEAAALLEQARLLMKPLIDDGSRRSPVIRNEWAFLCTRLGRLHRVRGEAEEALPWLDRAADERLRLWEESGEEAYRSELTVDWIEKALALRALKRRSEAEDVLRLAIDTQVELLARQPAPGAAELLDHMGNAWFFLGSIRAGRSDFAGAEAACLRALEIRRELHTRSPKKEVWVSQLIGSLDGLATVRLRLGHLPEAIRAWQEAAKLAQQLVEWRMRVSDGKARMRYVIPLVDAHLKAGRAMQLRGESSGALGQFEQSLEWLEKFAVNGADKRLFERLARGLTRLGAAHVEVGRLEEADEILQRSRQVALDHGLTEEIVANRLKRGRWAWEQGLMGRAKEAVETLQADQGDNQPDLQAEASLLQAEMLWEQQLADDAVESIRRAESRLADLCEADPRYEHHAALAEARLLGARFAAGDGRNSLADRWSEEAREFWEVQLQRDPGHLRARNALSKLKRIGRSEAKRESARGRGEIEAGERIDESIQ